LCFQLSAQNKYILVIGYKPITQLNHFFMKASIYDNILSLYRAGPGSVYVAHAL